MENVSVCIQRAPNGSAKERGDEFDEIVVVKFWKKNTVNFIICYNPIILQLFGVVMIDMTTTQKCLFAIILALFPLASEQTYITCRGIL